MVQTTITQELFFKLGFVAHLTVSWREPQKWCLPWEQRQSFLCSTLQDVSLWSSWLNELPYGRCARQHNQRTASAWVLLMLMSKYQICAQFVSYFCLLLALQMVASVRSMRSHTVLLYLTLKASAACYRRKKHGWHLGIERGYLSSTWWKFDCFI